MTLTQAREGSHDLDAGCAGAGYSLVKVPVAWISDESVRCAAGFRISGSRVSGFGFGFSGFGFQVSGSRVRVSGFGFRVRVSRGVVPGANSPPPLAGGKAWWLW